MKSFWAKKSTKFSTKSNLLWTTKLCPGHIYEDTHLSRDFVSISFICLINVSFVCPSVLLSFLPLFSVFPFNFCSLLHLDLLHPRSLKSIWIIETFALNVLTHTISNISPHSPFKKNNLFVFCLHCTKSSSQTLY